MGILDAELFSAQKLFESGEYNASLLVCSDLIDRVKEDGATDENRKTVYLLIAKNMLLSATPFDVEGKKKTIVNSLGMATSYIKTYDEYILCLTDIFESMNAWHRKWFCEYMEIIIKSPTNEAWKKYYIDTIMIPMQLRNYIAVCVDSFEHNKALYAAENNKTDKNKNTIQESNKFTKEEQCQILYETACAVFDKIVTFIEENKHSSREYLSTVGNQMISKIVLAELIIDAAIGDVDKTDKLKYLHKKAEILYYRLTVKVYPNGKPILLFDKTEENKTKLNKAYNQIKKLDESFEIPQIPDVSIKESTGGCYVATAVYGSYDCPEVWTLRRFRDNTLAKSLFGRLFIWLYYAVSPTLVKWFGKTGWFKNMWKPILDEKVKELNRNGVENTPYEDQQW